MSSDSLPTPHNTAAAPAGFWGSDLNAAVDRFTWVWEGYLAAAQVTLLTSQWKSGKTTLLSILLSRLKEGGMLAGLPVVPGRAVVVSEEPRMLWRPRHERLDLGHVYFFCRPFAGRPTLQQWLDLLDHIDQLRSRHGASLLAIDTLASFLPGGNECNATTVMDALLPLSRLTQQGMSVLLSHHPRKGPTIAGQAARGSGAFPGFCDIVLEMQRCPNAGEDDRRRRILGFSRSERTPRQLVLELNAEATDYVAHGDFQADEFLAHWDQLRLVFEDARDKLTRRQILDDWPADFPRPCDVTLWHWLQRAVHLGLIAQQGTGRKKAPFRYWLPAKEKQWQADPLWQLQQLALPPDFPERPK